MHYAAGFTAESVPPNLVIDRMFISDDGKKASLFGNDKEWNVSYKDWFSG
jgi:hypothetical protein